MLHQVRLSLWRERVVARERPSRLLELLAVHSEHVVPTGRVPSLVRGGGGGQRGSLRGSRVRRVTVGSAAEVLLHLAQAVHRGGVGSGGALGGGDSPVSFGRCDRGFVTRLVTRAVLPFRLLLAAPPGFEPTREPRVPARVPHGPDHRRLLLLGERLALPAEHALQNLRARPPDDEPHQPALLPAREVLFEQRPELSLLPGDVRLEANLHGDASRLKPPLNLHDRRPLLRVHLPVRHLRLHRVVDLLTIHAALIPGQPRVLPQVP